jgi:hypothetical protein
MTSLQIEKLQMAKMPMLDLKSMLASEKANALAAISAARLMEERADAMDYYLGDMRKDMPAQDGRSRAVSTDVADTIEGLMPPLMDIFAGSDEVVRFEPVGPEDEAAAQQETDYVNHVFMQQNPGFMILYSFIKDALLSSPVLSERCGSASRSCSKDDEIEWRWFVALRLLLPPGLAAQCGEGGARKRLHQKRITKKPTTSWVRCRRLKPSFRLYPIWLRC